MRISHLQIFCIQSPENSQLSDEGSGFEEQLNLKKIYPDRWSTLGRPQGLWAASGVMTMTMVRRYFFLSCFLFYNIYVYEYITIYFAWSQNWKGSKVKYLNNWRGRKSSRVHRTIRPKGLPAKQLAGISQLLWYVLRPAYDWALGLRLSKAEPGDLRKFPMVSTRPQPSQHRTPGKKFKACIQASNRSGMTKLMIRTTKHAYRCLQILDVGGVKIFGVFVLVYNAAGFDRSLLASFRGLKFLIVGRTLNEGGKVS